MRLLWIVAFLAAAATAQDFKFPSGIALDASGKLIIADRAANYVFRADLARGTKEVIAGTGTSGFSGDGGLAVRAAFAAPEWIALDKAQNIFVGDRANHRIRRIDARSGVVTTFAGNGAIEFAGDGGPAAQAAIRSPYGLLFDADENMIVFDTDLDRIRRIDAKTGVIRTIVGNGERGFSGDGPGTDVKVARPHNGTLDREGNLVFGDSFNQRIRVWNRRTGAVTTIAGKGERADPPHGVAAIDAPFWYFGGMAVNPDGDVIFSGLNNRIHKLDLRARKVLVLGGPGGQGSAEMNTPYGLVIAPGGEIVFADADNHRICAMDPRTGAIRTVVR